MVIFTVESLAKNLLLLSLKHASGHLHGDLHRGKLSQESPSNVSLTYLQVIVMVIFTMECFAKNLLLLCL
jgi:hypothetical protein